MINAVIYRKSYRSSKNDTFPYIDPQIHHLRWVIAYTMANAAAVTEKIEVINL